MYGRKLPEPARLAELPTGARATREAYRVGGKEPHRVVWMEPPPWVDVDRAYLNGFKQQIDLIRNVSDAYATYELIRPYYEKLPMDSPQYNASKWALLLITGQANDVR